MQKVLEKEGKTKIETCMLFEVYVGRQKTARVVMLFFDYRVGCGVGWGGAKMFNSPITRAHIHHATLETFSIAFARIRRATLERSSAANARMRHATLETSSVAFARIRYATLGCAQGAACLKQSQFRLAGLAGVGK